MIIIDTNVISEMMRTDPSPVVLAWVEDAGRLHTTSVTLAEVGYGIARLPDGHRKEALAATAAEVFVDFHDLILPFDVDAARRYANIVSGCEAVGRPVSTADAQIAAICAAHDATLATRNTDDFQEASIRLVDPWTASVA